MATLLPRYRFGGVTPASYVRNEKKLGRALLASGNPVPDEARAGRSELDAERLRGIPAIGRSVSGVIAGTDPYLAYERAETEELRRAELRHRATAE